MNRVFVTGLGVTSPVGTDLATFWQGLITGRDIFAEAAVLPGDGLLVGAIPPEVTFSGLPLKSLAPCDRNAILAVSAAQKALDHAGLGGGLPHPERVAVVIGNGAGGQMSMEEQYDRLFRQGRRLSPFTIVKAMVSSSASWVALAFGAKGPCFVTASACASGTQAIGTAYQLIKAGICDVAITGGTEAPLSMGTLLAWDAMKVMSRTKCRPFSLGREGLMVSEGAGMVILESEAHARARGADRVIELAGFSSNADAGDIVAPTVEGMRRAIVGALADAGVGPAAVAYINAHGTGTRQNDLTETEALKSLFAADAMPAVSSTKAVTGHALGAAGGIEAVATVLAMQHGYAPPTANFTTPDPLCDIDVIPNVGRAMPIPFALSNSFAFGGVNACVAFRHHG